MLAKQPTEAVAGRASEMDLQYGDNEESDAAAICVVEEGDDSDADSVEVWRQGSA